MVDVECVQLYAAQVDESTSFEAVREVFSKIPGSLNRVFVAEREDAK